MKKDETRVHWRDGEKKQSLCGRNPTFKSRSMYNGVRDIKTKFATRVEFITCSACIRRMEELDARKRVRPKGRPVF